MPETKTILLVEDEPVVIQMVEIVIISLGYDLIIAMTGEEAVKLVAENEKIDLILMDINLGEGIEGPEAARRILAKKEIPIIFHTSHSEEEYVNKVKEITRYGYLLKGSSRFVFREAIQMAFELFEKHEKLRLSEEILKQRNEVLLQFINRSPYYSFIKEVTPTKSLVIMASENFIDMIGIPGSEMTGKTMEELFPPEHAAKFTADDWKVVSDGNVLKLNEELNGRNYITIKFPILLENKKLLAGYTIDISEQKQKEDQIRYIQFANNNLSELFLWISPEGKITDGNGACCTKLGYSYIELTQLTIYQLDNSLDKKKWDEYFTDLRKFGFKSFDTSYKTKSGKLIPIKFIGNHFKLNEKEYACAFLQVL